MQNCTTASLQGKYDLIALDMDGTVMNSDKAVSGRTVAAIRRAMDAGKHVVLSTGRCLSELEQFLPLFPGLRYLISESGACVYDLAEKKTLAAFPLPAELAELAIRMGIEKNAMMQICIDGISWVNLERPEEMALYHLGDYAENFRKGVRFDPEIVEICLRDHPPVRKVNLFFEREEDREWAWKILEKYGLELAASIGIVVEISRQGVNKGVGLQKLCAHMGISEKSCIAVGDSTNDIAILKEAGLAAAMGNSVPEVLELADIVVADCDHDGVAEVIENYLLSENKSGRQGDNIE